MDSDRNGIEDGDEDSDGDGLRNSVERAASNPWRPTPTATASRRQDDPDGDGAPNLAEQQAGTDPGSSEEVPPVVETEDPAPR